MMSKKDIEICRKLHKKHGKSYYFATKFFPKKIRQATYVLYAFFRIPDEIVDNPKVDSPEKVRGELEVWIEKWRDAYKNKKSDEPVLRATQAVFHEYNIPYEYSEAFLEAMIMDAEKKRYETHEELEKYMYGSAAVVGLMMTYVIGFSNKKALEYAKELGYAMQLTNFLRDIREDYEDRDRIYLPKEDMKKFGVSEYGIHEHVVGDTFKELLKFEIDRTRKLYKNSEKGIEMLNKEGRLAVKLASVLYGAILGKIEEADYDIFSSRVGTSFWEKVKLIKQVF